MAGSPGIRVLPGRVEVGNVTVILVPSPFVLSMSIDPE